MKDEDRKKKLTPSYTTVKNDPKSSNNLNKVQVKKNDIEDGKKKRGGKEAEKATVTKRERKVYDLPGQKRDPPEERDPLRIFYETLHEQIPGSVMAAIWMMESGLLPRDKAIKVLDKKQKTAQKQKLSSPMKSVVTVQKKGGGSVTVKKQTTSTPETKQKNTTSQMNKTPSSKVASQQLNKRRIQEDSSEEDSDDGFIARPNKAKTQRLY